MLATQDVWDIEPPPEGPRTLGERLIDKSRFIALMHLSFAQDAAEFAASDEYEEWGDSTSIDWIRIHCHMTGPQAANYVAVGEQTDKLPQTVLAMAEGAIGFGHVVSMARAADALTKSPTARVFNEEPFLAKARENTVGRFHHLCRHLRHAADPKGVTAVEVDMVENRSLQISSDDDGAVYLNGVFDPVGGAAIRTALEPLARRSGADDHRPYDRRLADALVERSMHELDSGQVPQSASQRTHLQVTDLDRDLEESRRRSGG